MKFRVCILLLCAAAVCSKEFLKSTVVGRLLHVSDPIEHTHSIVKLVDKFFRSRPELPNLVAGFKKLEEAGAYETYKSAAAKNQDKSLNLIQLIKKYGHSVEKHTVTTEDGYILTLFRILAKGDKDTGKPLLIIHGLLNSANDWITPGANKSLPYLAAERGRDVWLGNVRGNHYSVNHTTLPTDSKAFWNFSWDEIGRHDLPAMIDYILEKTCHTQLQYVGHSQGTTSFFVMGSERPAYNKKVSLMVALAPVARVDHIVSPVFRLLSPASGLLGTLLSMLGVYKVDPDELLIKALTKNICGDTLLAELLCSNIIFLFCGIDFAELDVQNLPVIMTHTPSSASIKQILHYSQEINTGGFRKYDYGLVKNLKIYGSAQPPEYPVARITAPVALFYGENDWLSSTTDVATLRNKLPNVVDYYKVPPKTFNHLDFLIARHSKKLVHSRLLDLLDKH